MFPFNLVKSESFEEMSIEASNHIIDVMQEQPESLFCFAGGDTPVRTLELLVEAHHEKKIDLTKAFYIGLDEWVGLDETDQGSCLYYMNKNLFIPADIPKEQIHFFDAKSDNLKNECNLANNFIMEHHGITLSLLGVGVNGHLGFNEPGTSFDSLSHVITLDGSTKTIGEKYFEQEIEINKGITLGIRQILDSEHIIVLASGESKREALSKLLQGEVTAQWPITSLNKHENCTVFAHDVL